jgi:signal transduction histidine kinase
MVPARKQVEQTLADARAVHSDLSLRVESRTEELQEAIKARDQFLSIASHELKTPLTSLKLQLELLHKRIAKGVNETSSEKFSQSLRLSSLQVDRLTVLVEDLLDVSRIQAGKLSIHSENVNLTEVVQSAIEQFSETAVKSGCQIELKIENEIQGFWDYSRIEQVLANLISNAIKYAPGSKIEIAVRNVAPWAEISVKDNGPGIEPHRQARIFERFERATSSRSISGLGLGLFIVRELVNAHKGLIEVKSTPGQGSQFIVRLPLPQSAEATSSSRG